MDCMIPLDVFTVEEVKVEPYFDLRKISDKNGNSPLLLSLYRDREQLLKGTKTKMKTLWEEVARDMSQQCYEYTGSQCEAKLKNFKL